MIRLLIAATVLGGAIATANAAPARSPQGVMPKAMNCVQAKRCVAKDVFTGKALKEWAEVSKVLGTKIQVSNVRVVVQVAPAHAAKWTRKWSKAADELAKAGYHKKKLHQLGNGRGVVQIGPKAAIALISLKMTMGTRTRDEHLMFSMVKQGVGWRIAFIEDSPSKHVRFWTNKAPRRKTPVRPPG